MTISVSIVSIKTGHTTFRVKFLQTTILIEHRTLADIGMKIKNREDGAVIKDETTDTKYLLNISRDVVVISRDQEEDIEVYSNDFNIAIDKVIKCAEDTKALALIYGPKIVSDVILKAMENNKPVVVNEMAHFGHRILGYDGFAFEVIPRYGTNLSRERRFILHSHVHTIGILE